MKKSLYLSLLAGVAIAFTGCGDPLLDDLDSNIEVSADGGSTAQNIEQAAGYFLTAQQKIHDVGTSGGPHVYQVQFNIHIDNYSGYMAGTQNYGGNLPSAYRYFASYHEGPKHSFFKVAQSTLPVMRAAKDLNLRELGAMCNIMYCLSALELSDIYGPFPWTDYKNDVQEPPVTYEPMDVIYDSIFVNLKESVEILNAFNDTPTAHQDSINNILAEYDRICGTPKVWAQLGNTIRLRMALRLSNIAPDRAKAEAEAAYNNPDGLIEKSIEYNTMNHNSTSNPLYWISKLWNDTRLNASMENIMKRLNVPFMDKLFAKNNGDIKNEAGEVTMPSGEAFVGIRTGIQLTPRDDNNKYLYFSVLNDSYANVALPIVKVSERWFLQAEAALRWNICGSMNTNYLNGVAAMMEEHGFVKNSDEFRNYFNQTEADQTIHYVDPSNERNNLNGLLTVGVKMGSSDTPQTKLEKIITQKWLSMFPLGLEAWNDLRRTGFPRIFPTNDIGDGSLGKGRMVRRVPWDMTDAAAAQDVNTSGIPALGGPNIMRTSLWWDVEDPAGIGDNRRWEREASGL